MRLQLKTGGETKVWIPSRNPKTVTLFKRKKENNKRVFF
jgi:hypothetical protein